jgi:K+-transporting ATPase ATPase C chain
MKELVSNLRMALVSTCILTALCCGLYPMVVYGIGQVFFPEKANGSLISDAQGTIRGSRLMGQPFSGRQYFHTRPSLAGSGYDAANSSGSNLGPTSQKLHDAIAERIERYRKENDLSDATAIPADAVTSSASGLDPHISLRNAHLQIRRVALARNLGEDKVRDLVHRYTSKPDLGFLGEGVVSVLELNLALDSISAKP